MKDWEKGYLEGSAVAIFGCIVGMFLMAYTKQSCAQNWDNSPANYANSQYNYNNSAANYNNSPYNYNNSPYNSNSHGVYDNNGNRKGYETTSSEGTRNIFDNNGNRIGYESLRK
jgi:hypothetical protein